MARSDLVGLGDPTLEVCHRATEDRDSLDALRLRSLRELVALARELVGEILLALSEDVDAERARLEDRRLGLTGLVETHQRTHLRRKRSPALRKRKIAEAMRHGQRIACEVCGFDFSATYGERGNDYIECHHRTPLHATGPTLTRLRDLALICSNCHRIIHRTARWLSIEELGEIVRTRCTATSGL